MLEKPIKYRQFHAPETVRFREEDPAKFIGGPTILVKSFKSERDRIRVTSYHQKQRGYNVNLSLVGEY